MEKVISKYKKRIDQYHFFLLLRQSVRGDFMIACLIFLQKTNQHQILNQVLSQVIHVLINFFLSPMKHINLLVIILKSELYI